MFQFKLYNNVTGEISCYINGEVYNVKKDHLNYEKLLEAFKTNDTESFVKNYTIIGFASTMPDGSNSGLEILPDSIRYKGKEIDYGMKHYILELRKDGFDISYLVRFLENLLENPSANSVRESFVFLQQKNLPISEDGAFIGYKRVSFHDGETFIDQLGKVVKKGDYVDCYSKTIRNNIGDINSIERNQVDDNIEKECSFGFHVGGLSYSGPSGIYAEHGDVTVLVKVFPKDIVSVPAHESNKMRVCRYEVIGEYSDPLPSSVYK